MNNQVNLRDFNQFMGRGADPDQKIAFIEGFKWALAVHNCALPSTLTPLEQELCILGQLVEQEERTTDLVRGAAQQLLKKCHPRKGDLRAMLFDCATLNDDGEEVDEDSNPTAEHRPWPCRMYLDANGNEISEAEYVAKSANGCKCGVRSLRYLPLYEQNDEVEALRIDERQTHLLRELLKVELPMVGLELLERFQQEAAPGGLLEDYGDIINEVARHPLAGLMDLIQKANEVSAARSAGFLRAIVIGPFGSGDGSEAESDTDGDDASAFEED